MSFFKITDFVLNPWCKPLEGFKTKWGITWSDLNFEELSLEVARERMGKDRIETMTKVLETDAVVQGERVCP